MAIDGLDPLPAVAELLGNLAEAVEATEDQAQIWNLETAEIGLPIELELVQEGDGPLELGMSPPTQQITTSVMPVWHHLRIRVDADAE